MCLLIMLAISASFIGFFYVLYCNVRIKESRIERIKGRLLNGDKPLKLIMQLDIGCDGLSPQPELKSAVLYFEDGTTEDPRGVLGVVPHEIKTACFGINPQFQVIKTGSWVDMIKRDEERARSWKNLLLRGAQYNY